ncbi:hypothetical protein Bbelb_105320 [Branchiostoma belcheri]|nr:hypothetical protein Bbelb_105320 [Branchiostoma belcheri]
MEVEWEVQQETSLQEKQLPDKLKHIWRSNHSGGLKVRLFLSSSCRLLRQSSCMVPWKSRLAVQAAKALRPLSREEIVAELILWTPSMGGESPADLRRDTGLEVDCLSHWCWKTEIVGQPF